MPFAGGILQYGYQCGMIWGSVLAAGAQSYKLFGPGPKSESAAILTAGKLIKSFIGQNEHINCIDITDIDKNSTVMQMITFFVLKGGTLGCFRMASDFANTAYNVINSSLADENIEVPSPPVSCAAVLAKKLGASDKQISMAAGLAGGIGLCGGACGALGAAIWINSMRINTNNKSKVDFKDPVIISMIEKFLKFTEYKFECFNIVGRKFDGINEHSEYIRQGGCSELIDLLATIESVQE